MKSYRAKVTGRHAVTLPAELCRALHIENGDSIEFQLQEGSASIRRAGELTPPPARGLLRGYFPDWESVNRHVAVERAGWDERLESPSNNLPSERDDTFAG